MFHFYLKKDKIRENKFGNILITHFIELLFISLVLLKAKDFITLFSNFKIFNIFSEKTSSLRNILTKSFLELGQFFPDTQHEASFLKV